MRTVFPSPQYTSHKQFPISWETQPQVDPALGCQLACLLRGMLEPPPAPTMSRRPLQQSLGRLLRTTGSARPAFMIITDGLGDTSTLWIDRQAEFRDRS